MKHCLIDNDIMESKMYGITEQIRTNEEFDNPAKVRGMDGWMDGKKTRLGEGVGEATRSHNLHSGGAGKWFLESGPQLSSPAIMKINTKYFILWLCYVLWSIYGCNAETSWFCAQLHFGNM